MIKTTTILILIFSSIVGFSQSQTEMNQKAIHELDSVESILKSTCDLIMRDYKTDSIFIKRFLNSQKKWEDYKNAQLDMLYPNPDKRFYGSVYPLCKAEYLKKLTIERIDKLNNWVELRPSGDICTGSIKIREHKDMYYPIEYYDNKVLTRYFNQLEILKEFKTDELSIRIIQIGNFPGSAGFDSGEITHNLYFAVSEFDEYPKQNLFVIKNLYNLQIDNIDTSKSKNPIVEISFGENIKREKLRLEITIDKLTKASH